jgi:hypothetical protein
LSPLNLQVYRRKTAGSSAGDPSIDPANWQRAFNEAFSAVDVLTISADLALTAVIRNVLRVASTVKNSSIKLPSANSLSNTNGTYLIKNTGALPLPVRDNAGTLLAVLPGGGASGIFACEDFSTAAGTWLVIAPENMAAIATGAATVWALASCSWCYISSIPGAADKALVAWISGGAMYAAIATRSGSGAVSIGTAANIGNCDSLPGAMCVAMSSAAAFATLPYNAATSQTLVALTLNTANNTVAVASTKVISGTYGLPVTWVDPQPQVLDATRAAWIYGIGNNATMILLVAQHNGGAAPTFSKPISVGWRGRSPRRVSATWVTET